MLGYWVIIGFSCWHIMWRPICHVWAYSCESLRIVTFYHQSITHSHFWNMHFWIPSKTHALNSMNLLIIHVILLHTEFWPFQHNKHWLILLLYTHKKEQVTMSSVLYLHVNTNNFFSWLVLQEDHLSILKIFHPEVVSPFSFIRVYFISGRPN